MWAEKQADKETDRLSDGYHLYYSYAVFSDGLISDLFIFKGPGSTG